MTQDNHMAHVAQLVEHVLGKDEVTRSIRVVGSIPSFASAAPSIKWARIRTGSSRNINSLLDPEGY